MVTLAPERTTPEFIRQLSDAGVIVRAGHTNATFDELQPAFAAGLRGFTHLFNAMSPLGNREPGTVGAALAHDASWCGLIVDGHHVHPEVMKLALRAKRHDRFMLVTDAMPSVGADDQGFRAQWPAHHGGRQQVRGRGRAGSPAPISTWRARCATRCSMLGVSLVDAVRMASAHPAEFLALRDVGRIAPGQRANLVRLDEDCYALETWIDGKSQSSQ